MPTHRCRDCGVRVHSGEAQVRSVMFELVYWCRDCWAQKEEGLVVPLRAPQPRVSPEDEPVHEDPVHPPLPRRSRDDLQVVREFSLGSTPPA